MIVFWLVSHKWVTQLVAFYVFFFWLQIFVSFWKMNMISQIPCFLKKKKVIKKNLYKKITTIAYNMYERVLKIFYVHILNIIKFG